MEHNDIKRGEIYYFENNNFRGSEEGGNRPGIVVSNNLNNRNSRNVTVVWLTSQEKKPMPTHVDIYTKNGKSTALCEQVNTVTKDRIISYLATCTQKEMEEVERGLICQLALGNIGASEPGEEYEEPEAFVEYVEVASDKEKQLEAELNTYKELYKDLLDRFTGR